MATNVTDVVFDEGNTMNLEVGWATGVQTYQPTSIEFTEHGVMAEHVVSGTAYRMLIPWHLVNQVWQLQ